MHVRLALRALAGLCLFAALPGCGREFPAPPPAIQILGFSPAEGFQGDLVAVCGRNLGVAQEGFSLLAYFGTQPAEVLAPLPLERGQGLAGFTCDAEVLGLRVPALAAGSRVSLTLSAADGQATTTDTFHALGPGHPLAETPGQVLRLVSAPSSVSVVLPDERPPIMNPVVVTNQAARSISVVDLDTGWHADLGLGGMPLSAALVPLPRLEGAGDRAGVHYRVALYITEMLVGDEGLSGGVETRLDQQLLDVFVPDLPGENPFEVSLTPILERDEATGAFFLAVPDGFSPGQVRQACLTTRMSQCGTPICEDRLVMLTALEAPSVALYGYSSFGLPCGLRVEPVGVRTLTTAGTACLAAPGEQEVPPGPIADVALVPVAADLAATPMLHLVAEGRPEVWTLSIDPSAAAWVVGEPSVSWPRDDLDEAVAKVAELYALCTGPNPPVACPDPGVLARLPALAEQVGQTTAGLDACALRYSALALRDRREATEALQTLFFAEPTLRALFQADYFEVPAIPAIGLAGYTGFVPYRKLTLPSPAYAMVAAHDGQKPWLLVASEDGLRTVDVRDTDDAGAFRQLRVDAFQSLPGSRGSPLSIGRYGAGDDDRWDYLVFADTVRDRLLVLPIGQPVGDPVALPVGMVTPQVAASQFSDTLYVADPLANTIRLVDESSGVQNGQFSVREISSFGAMDITCLHRGGADLLMVPILHEYVRPGLDQRTFDQILSRGAADAGAILDWQEGLRGGAPGEPVAGNLMAHPFNELLPAPRSGLYFLMDYWPPEDPALPRDEGLLWTALTDDTDAAAVTLVDDPTDWTGDKTFVGYSWPLASHVSMVRLDPGERWLATYGLLPDGAGALEVLAVEDAEPLYRLELQPPTSSLVSDVALRVEGETVTAYLALPESGHVLALRIFRATQGGEVEAQSAFLETTGVPERFAWSPDGRRLYVTHRVEGKLTILETDCLPAAECSPASPCPDGRACRFGLCTRTGEGTCPAGSAPIILDLATFEAACLPDLCDRVRGTLTVPASPAKVVFHPSGKAAYVTHAGSGEISVIR
ncbi:MAG TPA: hypothetical protein PK668_07820 [Myxococcota bacterium]|nr:hypothetical protein [Myxococcota bacterium]HRY93119.1 hypothetical protein [Myxococcota bacterium]